MALDYQCKDCGCTFDIPKNAHRLEYECPDCDSMRWGIIQERVNRAITPDQYDWSSENGGKGRRISQLDKGVREPYYARSRQSAIDEAKRRGHGVRTV